MIKKRIQVYADEETKRRIELAAAKYDLSVTEYCLEAIRRQLVEDDMLEREQIEIPVKKKAPVDLLADLRKLRERILAEHGGRLLDIDEAIEQLRQGRDYELTGLS